MLDDLRNSASASPDPYPDEDELVEQASQKKNAEPFLGMTPVQRFIVVLMLFLMTCVVGTFFLIVFEKIVLPV